jgi:periodic tryptophan protein 2
VKLWNVWKSECVETLEHPSDVLCVAWRPDGKQLTAGTLHGQLHLWDPEEGDELGTIDGQRDIAGGRGLEARRLRIPTAVPVHSCCKGTAP